MMFLTKSENWLWVSLAEIGHDLGQLIVEKCDRLMSVCDTLESKLKQGRDSSEKLMQIAAKQVLIA